MTALRSGRKTVTSSGTRVQLATTTPVLGVAIQALSDNTSKVAVGDNTVVAAAGATQVGPLLAAGESISLPADDLSDIWIDAQTSGEGVTWTAVIA